MRTGLIVILMVVYVILGLYDIFIGRNIQTGIPALMLAVINGMLFFAGGDK